MSLESSSAKSVLTALAIAPTLLSVACGGIFEQRHPRGASSHGAAMARDDFACVESSLRGEPDAAIVGEAADHFRAECDGGEPAACSALGVMHELGRGVPRDMPQAVELYMSACQQRYARGCVNLGQLHAEGVGVPQRWSQAAALYDLACQARNAEGCYRIAQLQDQGRGVTQNSAYAAALYARSCESGHAAACIDLGVLHERGRGTPQDLTRAVQLYEQACRAGDVSGCFELDRLFMRHPEAATVAEQRREVAPTKPGSPLAPRESATVARRMSTLGDHSP